MSSYEDPYCVLPRSGSSTTLGSTLESIKANTNATLDSLHDLKEDIAQMSLTNEKGVEGVNSLTNAIQETSRDAELARGDQASSKQQGMIVTSKKLLELLAVDTARIRNEATILLRRGRSYDQSAHDRGHLLIHNRGFQAWQASGQSRLLLVDGNAGSASERVSAMTVACALLAHTLPNEIARTIMYFCGLHTDPADTLGGPCGILRAILAQLIQIYEVHLDFVDSEEYDGLQRFNLRRLCIVLGVVKKKLPTKAVVFCVIDGISLYGKDEWLEETCYALRMIGDLARDPEVSAIFKLLVTSPLASRHVAKYVQDEGHVVLPHNPYGGDGSSIRNGRLMMQSRSMAGKGKTVEEFDRISFDETPFNVNFDEGNFEEDNTSINNRQFKLQSRRIADKDKDVEGFDEGLVEGKYDFDEGNY